MGEAAVNTGQRVDLAERTRAFALRIVRLYASLPKDTVAQVLGTQLLRSGTSVGAHYREARRGRSNAEFISKMNTGLQELDETDYWLDLLVGAGFSSAARLAKLREETQALLKIFVACIKTAKSR